MTRTRVLFRAAALIAAVLAAQLVVLQLWSLGMLAVQRATGELVGDTFITVGLLWAVIFDLLHCAAFGVGVFLALRFIAPIEATTPWRRVVRQGVIATVSGAVCALAFTVIVTLIAAIRVGDYPFGYDFSAGIDSGSLQSALPAAIAASITPLIVWLPVAVLGVVLLRVSLAAHPVSTEATDRASVAA